MAEETQEQDGQKTLVAFIVGLLIGGMLVWAFSGPSADAPTPAETSDTTEETSEMESEDDTSSEDSEVSTTDNEPVVEELVIGDGDVVVNDQPASNSIALDSATYPISEGWIGVREYDNDNLGYILGVVRFSESQNLVPNEIILQRSTIPGRQYAVVIYSDNGDFSFNLANDVQIDTIFDTFRAE